MATATRVNGSAPPETRSTAAKRLNFAQKPTSGGIPASERKSTSRTAASKGLRLCRPRKASSLSLPVARCRAVAHTHNAEGANGGEAVGDAVVEDGLRAGVRP